VVDDSYLPGSVEAKDVGLTINTIFAMAAAQEYDMAAPLAAWVASKEVIDTYASDTPSMTYPGRIALTGLALNIENLAYPAGADAQLTVLENRLIARLQEDGRFTDDSDFTDTSSPISQSLALIFLHKRDALGDLEADPLDFLVGAACEDGSFPLILDLPGPCAGAVDSTAHAIMALQLFEEKSDALEMAVDWLIEQQNDQGQWDGWEGPSVDSTALGLLALQDVRTGPASLAVADSWTALAKWQLPNGAWPSDLVIKEPDIRATAAGAQGTAQASLLVLLGFKER